MQKDGRLTGSVSIGTQGYCYHQITDIQSLLDSLLEYDGQKVIVKKGCSYLIRVIQDLQLGTYEPFDVQLFLFGHDGTYSNVNGNTNHGGRVELELDEATTGKFEAVPVSPHKPAVTKHYARDGTTRVWFEAQITLDPSDFYNKIAQILADPETSDDMDYLLVLLVRAPVSVTYNYYHSYSIVYDLVEAPSRILPRKIRRN